VTPGDEKQVDRFAAFLRIMAEAVVDPNGGRLVTDETRRYALGEDVEPVPVDDTHPATWTLRGPSRATKIGGDVGERVHRPGPSWRPPDANSTPGDHRLFPREPEGDWYCTGCVWAFGYRVPADRAREVWWSDERHPDPELGGS